MTAAIVTNVLAFAGEPVAAALAAAGTAVLCHDPAFASPEARAAFEAGHPGCRAASAAGPEGLVAEALERFGTVDAAVSNDAFPARRTWLEEAGADDFRAHVEALLIDPFRLVAATAAAMKPRRSGRIVLLTSALPLHPYPGFAMYASARAGASALAQAAARELAPHGIVVNAVAPNFLASETYYPRAQWVDDPKYVQRIKDLVPLQRLGRPEEIGALVAFLLSGASDFVTGQVINFTGGWP